MKSKQVALCLASFLILLATHSICAADTTKDEEAIKAVVATFDKAMNAKDAAALSSVFNEDGEFTNVIGMTARGRRAIEQFHRPLFEGDGTKGVPSFKNAVFKVAETRIRFIRPDVASVDVTWTQTGSTLLADRFHIGRASSGEGFVTHLPDFAVGTAVAAESLDG